MSQFPYRAGAEQFYVVVWYAACQAEEAFLGYLQAVERGEKTDRWSYLAAKMKEMGASPERVPYRTMREDLASFANTFGLAPDSSQKEDTMRVNIYETVEVSTEERVQIAALLDGPGAKKRQATRDEMKQFVWAHGEGWQAALAAPVAAAAADEDALPEGIVEEDEDLLGSAGDDEDLLGGTPAEADEDEDLI